MGGPGYASWRRRRSRRPSRPCRATYRRLAPRVGRANARGTTHPAEQHRPQRCERGGPNLYSPIPNWTSPASPLIQMIDEARVSTFYQPIWDLETATLLGLEALMRPDPELGFAGPAEAFDIAEHIDRVHPLDVLSTTSALQISPRLPDGALLFVNLSPLSASLA